MIFWKKTFSKENKFKQEKQFFAIGCMRKTSFVWVTFVWFELSFKMKFDLN
tara:strand:+ start:227 stop:379 length:153 start_codon:yes stop_codon:yes gene_type:complete